MLSLLVFLAVLGGWSAARAGLHALRALPRSNDDLVFF